MTQTLTGARRVVLLVVGGVLGAYLVVRAIAEPFVIDMTDPGTYANDWGGPSLIGVLAVHCGPGIVALGIGFALLRRRAARTAGRNPGQ